MIRRLIILLLIVGCVFAREYIAIIDFEGIGVSTDDAKTLTQRLTSEMIALEVYQVLERSEMKRLLEEQKFQYSGCVDLKCAKLEKLDDEYWAEVIREDLIIENGNLGNIIFSPLDKINN